MGRTLGPFLAALILAGCPGVLPPPFDPVTLRPGVGPVVRLAAAFRVPHPEPLALLKDLQGCFRTHRVHAFRLATRPDGVTARKVLVNPPGLLRDLEVNRFVANFVRAVAGGDRVVFFRADAQVERVDVPALLRRARRAIRLAPDRAALAIADEVTPLVHRFRRAALSLPRGQVAFRYREEASTLTLRVTNPEAIRALRRRVGWADLTPEAEPFAARAAEERRIFVAVGGVVVLEDVIRPGAQLVEGPGGRPAWEFHASVKADDWRWMAALLQRPQSVAAYTFTVGPPP